jgi:hypothetical protein
MVVYYNKQEQHLGKCRVQSSANKKNNKKRYSLFLLLKICILIPVELSLHVRTEWSSYMLYNVSGTCLQSILVKQD